GIAGRTEGGGALDFGPTDLSAATQPIVGGTVYEVFSGDEDLADSTLEYAQCELLDPPSIAVDPGSFDVFVECGSTLEDILTITNEGDLPLDYNITLGQPVSAAKSTGVGGAGVLDWRKLDNPTEKYTPTVQQAEKLARETELERTSEPVFRATDGGGRITLPHNYAIQVFSEDFNAGFPAGWSTVDNTGSGVIWQVPAQGGGNYTGGSGDAAGASSDFVGPAEYDTGLISSVISGYGPNVVLSYVANYQNFANRDFLDVDISTDGGANWTTVFSWNEDHGGFFGPPGEAVNIPLDAALGGASSFQVRWHWYNPQSGDFDWYAQIDDVSIVSDEV
ncbi:MAG: choice-of-anchor J domain-containing protein, partial [Acidimicrobiia bacterium]|nr:choice-of-anchor J domain-containing protein [Acidimicrobiia bacterium]